ncbi:hypothetical protein SDC9_130060 [bioreactor metagenome]|uniref:Uncharacterized protein n=1 Tax=bioreactor metagenome TaxID=1076179 RepID=A0A645D1C2_9ZZZZ
MNAHLVLQRTAENRVALAQRTIGLHLELGHDEQADALGADGRIGQTRQHQVHDVAGEVMLAGRDEDLVAGDLVAAVRQRLGLGAQQAQVGAAMGLGQAHGAGPLAAGQLAQIGLLLLRRAIGMQSLIGAMRQTGIHGPGLIGAVEHFIKRRIEHEGQTLAAILRIAGQCRPATLDELRIRLLEALGRGDLVGLLVQRAALFVAGDIQGKRDIGRKLSRLLDHRVDGVGIDLRVLGNLLIGFGDLEDLVHEELHVTQWRVVAGHLSSPVMVAR